LRDPPARPRDQGKPHKTDAAATLKPIQKPAQKPPQSDPDPISEDTHAKPFQKLADRFPVTTRLSDIRLWAHGLL
jgi:hypothetical protein